MRNVEIHELVGDDNIYIFGEDSETVIDLYAKEAYKSSEFYARKAIKPLVDFIIAVMLFLQLVRKRLERLYNELINKRLVHDASWLEDYIETKERMFADMKTVMSGLKKFLSILQKQAFLLTVRLLNITMKFGIWTSSIANSRPLDW